MPDGLAKCLVARLAFYAVKHLWRLFFPEPAARSRSPFSPGLTDPGDHGAHGATDGAEDPVPVVVLPGVFEGAVEGDIAGPQGANAVDHLLCIGAVGDGATIGEVHGSCRARQCDRCRAHHAEVVAVQHGDGIGEDAFEQVVRRWSVIANPPGYLRIAVLNGARSWGRRAHRRLPVPPTPHIELDEEAIAVREALGTLRHDEREVVVLRYFLGLTDSQIAHELGRPVGTVKSQIFRGLAHMKEVLS